MELYAFRLKPNEKLKESIFNFALENGIEAGLIVTCVGSLKHLNIRLASAKQKMTKTENFEIVSLTGTFNNNHEGHFHISVADESGSCFGGHLLDDNIINSTAEIVLAKVDNTSFSREYDEETKYKELIIR